LAMELYILGFRGMYMALAVIVFLYIIVYHFIHRRKSASIKQSLIENQEIELIS